MAFLTGTATSLDDLFSQLSTLITGTPGWTLNGSIASTGFGFSKGNVFVQFRYDGTSPPPEGRSVAMYQSLGYTGTTPGNETDDSGNGHFDATPPVADSSLDNERCIHRIGDGPFTFWFFVGDTTDYVHVVVEATTGSYRHFGFGNINKFGVWTGGEYVYGQHHSETPSSTSSAETVLLDGLFRDLGNPNRRRAATVHIEGMPGQDAASKWGICWNSTSETGTTRIDDDRGGNERVFCFGGARGGAIASRFGGFTSNGSSGYVPLIPINLFYGERPTGSRIVYLGSMADVAMVNIRNFTPGQNLTIGSDTWFFFPTTRRTTQSSGAPDDTSFTQGIAYRRVS